MKVPAARIEVAVARNGIELLLLQVAGAQDECARVGAAISDADIAAVHADIVANMTRTLDASGDEWKTVLPGKPIFNSFANQSRLQASRLKQAYIRAALKREPSPFYDIIEIFGGFYTSH